MIDKKLTKAINYEIFLPENDHLDINSSLDQDERLSDIQNLKIKIVKDVIGFYNKYPTLYIQLVLLITSNLLVMLMQAGTCLSLKLHGTQ